MSTVNYVDPRLDRTVRIFDSFYKYDTVVNENDYDVVYAFFKSVFTEELAAKNFTISLFQVADQSKIPVLDLLAEIQGQVPAAMITTQSGQTIPNPAVANQGQYQLQITATLAYYLNNLRSNSTLLGLSAPVVPNYYAARQVLP